MGRDFPLSTAFSLPLDSSASVTVGAVDRSLCRHQNLMVLYFHALLGVGRSWLNKYIFYFYNNILCSCQFTEIVSEVKSSINLKTVSKSRSHFIRPREILEAGRRFFPCGLRNLSVSSWLICLVGCLSK